MSHDTYHVGLPETYRPYSCHKSAAFFSALPSFTFEAMPLGSGGICSGLQLDFSKTNWAFLDRKVKGHITDPRHVQRPSGMLKMPWTVSAHGS
jgi:hypothetical protein